MIKTKKKIIQFCGQQFDISNTVKMSDIDRDKLTLRSNYKLKK